MGADQVKMDGALASVGRPDHVGPGRNAIFPIDIDSVELGPLGMDLYIDARRENRLVLYRTVGVEFSDAHRDKLREQGIEFLYVPTNQHRAYRRMLVGKLDRTYHDENLSRVERAKLVRASCGKMIEDALLFPERRVPFATIADVSSAFARWASEDQGQFAQLTDMAAHDYYTVLHMVNVGLGCGLLTQAMMPNDPQLLESTIQGGLLHDIGKRSIPEEVLNKEGRLDAGEWKLIQAHPTDGRDLLRQHTRSPHVVLQIVSMHHERLDGSGYPAGLGTLRIPKPARVCAVVDVFDAICSSRPYRIATPPSEALGILRDGAGSHFDPDVLNCWCEIVGQLCETPSQAADTMGDGLDCVLADFVEQPPAPVGAWQGRPVANSGKERRHYPRYRMVGHVKGRFIRKGKDYPVECSRWTDFASGDVSRGGLRIFTSWPLTVNDVMEFWLPTSRGGKTLRVAMVVRVHKGERNQWVAGLMFLRQSARS